mmetsp:Transcript_33902/g.74209  ORF Transcript_33902/g.74209 Transcript_33902/m.74209 type:complete len:320 (+) Transcript_33902:593-1552(+)
MLVLCFHAKMSEERMVPATTAMARSLTTVTRETRTMTTASERGILRMSRRLDHAKVDSQTTNMMPTSEAIGTRPRSGAAPTMPKPRKRDMATPASLEVAPDCTLTCVCPIIAQPPIPPVRPLTTLPRPWPMHSLDVLPRLPSSSRPSTSCMVRSDSMSPTEAIVAAKGSNVCSNCSGASMKGTAGSASLGMMLKPPLKVSAPARSASVVAGRAKMFATAVTIPTESREEGMAVVSRGRSFTRAMERPVRPHMVAPRAPTSRAPVTGSKKWLSCAFPMTMARPFTKPSMTGCGTSLMNFPQPMVPAKICSSPASMTAALR